jgi:hypothetical protein
MAASRCPRVMWRFAFLRALVASPETRVWAHALVEGELVLRSIDLSCEGSSSGKLVGDAVVRSGTGRLASEGLDEDLHAFPEMQHQVKGGLLLDVVVSKGTTILELLAG